MNTVNLVSRATLARMAGVSRASITKACRKQLAAACDGLRVDVAHPATVEYLSGRAPAPTVAGATLTGPELEALADAVFKLVLKRLRRVLSPDTRERATP